MFNKKLLASILIVLAILFAQVGNAAAAPQAQDSTVLIGTIESITAETDADDVTTVLVTFTDEQGESQTVRLSLETAADLFLIDPDTLQIDETLVGQTVVIDPTNVIPEEEPEEPDVHLISELLAKFFFEGEEENEMALLIDSFHTGDNEADQVFGFGVIAQALWIARDTDGNTDIDVVEDILVAKQTKDFEQFFADHEEYQDLLEDGAAPSNWGQFKKVLREKKENLGQVISGQADQEETVIEAETANQQNHGNGQNRNDKPKKEKKQKRH